jgi:hypothetical protein
LIDHLRRALNFDFATNRSHPHSYAEYEKGKRNVPTIIFMDGPPGTPNTVFRASAFRQLGGYDPQWPTGQDYDLMLRLSLLGRWLHVPGSAHQGLEPFLGAYTYTVTPRYFGTHRNLLPIDPSLGAAVGQRRTVLEERPNSASHEASPNRRRSSGTSGAMR